MTIKKLIWWVFSTLLIGCILGFALGMMLHIFPFKQWSMLLLTGTTCASVALLGFFAYLIFNWLGAGFVRNPRTFQWVQVVLIILTVGNLVYLFATKFMGWNLFFHLLAPLLIIAVAILVAWLKAKWTNVKAFVPSLFFMIVATVIESLPWIKPKTGNVTLSSIFYTVVILLSCNAWQILNLHKWVKRPEKGAKSKQEKPAKHIEKAVTSSPQKKKNKKKKKKKK
ncbi:KinB-signaling pathway activation protein [Thermoflavimicrobium dichotomicum]|uniref:KinB signaling pathway activation protein n=1 Tax=Thermoflavimicrobium dichotomicum TaxID=46223 RepID=A0A1I3R0W5_9BACL|nr:KinB-signaling pathway activation protein [Thermoflavimicrobium dichotomicum]SFJ39007.1 KinB signaling pathway activation protein [Thermoflavimicrobium dichotomicum]